MNSVNLSAQLSPWALFLHADVIVRTIIVLLVIASIASWAVIIDKTARLTRLGRQAGRWLTVLSGQRPLEALYEATAKRSSDPFARIFREILKEWDENDAQGLTVDASVRDGVKERISRVAQIANGAELQALHKGLGVLATIGSVAPFVGLFGTVWGIINAFQGIATSNNTSLAVVAPGIAEALFATALGLVAAIPAVVAYNRANGDLNAYAGRLSTLIGLIEVQISRQLDSGCALEISGRRVEHVVADGGKAIKDHESVIELSAQAS